MKRANNPGRPGAESLEPRKTEGNPGNGKNTGQAGVGDFIVEIEGARKNCDVTFGASSPTSKISKERCSSASTCTSRSGLIRELL